MQQAAWWMAGARIEIPLCLAQRHCQLKEVDFQLDYLPVLSCAFRHQYQGQLGVRFMWRRCVLQLPKGSTDVQARAAYLPVNALNILAITRPPSCGQASCKQCAFSSILKALVLYLLWLLIDLVLSRLKAPRSYPTEQKHPNLQMHRILQTDET